MTTLQSLEWRGAFMTACIAALLAILLAMWFIATVRAQPLPLPPGPSDVLGTWGAFDEKSGACAPDAVGVTLTAEEFTVDHGPDVIFLKPVGRPVCNGNRCTVITISKPKFSTWTWSFRTVDTALIEGNLPDDMAIGGMFKFKHSLKRDCQ